MDHALCGYQSDNNCDQFSILESGSRSAAFTNQRAMFVKAGSSIRVMVVEDFQPFRRFVCSELKKRAALRVICEVEDGLEAVQKAEELHPDLIFLDICLPTLNGIEAARRIRAIVPESKIIFSTQETSPDIVQEVMRQGACGYVFKTHAANDLLPAIDAALSGQRFVSFE
jgi:DNA-binding NarL/FixJ family response regulator